MGTWTGRVAAVTGGAGGIGLAIADAVLGAGGSILIGDLNTTMWSPWFGRLCAKSGLSSVRRGFGVLPSWPAPLPAFLRIPIDHCLVSDDLVVTGCRLGSPAGSDHLPLIVDLAVAAAQR